MSYRTQIGQPEFVPEGSAEPFKKHEQYGDLNRPKLDVVDEPVCVESPSSFSHTYPRSPAPWIG